MTNPQSTIPNAQLPYMTQQVTASDGTPTLLFHRFLTGLWQRTGGASGVNNSDVQVIADQALTLATQAGEAASAASAAANTAQNTADGALATANGANVTAQTALTAASSTRNTSLQINRNLADVQSVSSARLNLGLSTFPLTFSFDTPSANLKRGIPLTRKMVVPANFAGTVAWWGVAATATPIFNVGYSTAPSSVITPIGTIEVVRGTGINLSLQPSATLPAGATLVITCPGAPDATLAEFAVTIPLSLA